jgi:hypothetical protein
MSANELLRRLSHAERNRQLNARHRHLLGIELPEMNAAANVEIGFRAGTLLRGCRGGTAT